MNKAERKASQKLTWMVVGAGAAMLASTLVERSMATGWRMVTSDDPPKKPESPRTGWTDALAWTAASALAAGLSQIIAKRGAAIGWRAYTGKLPPA
ncbi:MAG TPA: DUF4235 domain-containing protein [Gemmatimonadaceae bacterium]|nr:DUF4235 domain-containing protein [Gemmatimonadaceae bacterium]